mgnify:CR=1 FL=1
MSSEILKVRHTNIYSYTQISSWFALCMTLIYMTNVHVFSVTFRDNHIFSSKIISMTYALHWGLPETTHDRGK